ncbi:MAG TPA: enoyl-CoA hydratase-related protein, partial [Acidimicrobiales bacterium]|nr:enoyl-CoA hydratase-related protein [Acidimicrobiales bacterium]
GERKFEAISFEQEGAVAWVTLNRPQVYNAFNSSMQTELRSLWRSLRYDDSVRAIVVTGAGDKAFCTGIDRQEAMEGSGESPAVDPLNAEPGEKVNVGSAGATPFMFDDPGESLGPKSCGLYKPVIAAVNGIACGGAFYILSEVEFMIASDNATFFDPHVTYGMTAAFEPMGMLSRMPFGEIMRMSLMGNAERMSAKRALEIGLVSEVVPFEELRDRAAWAASTIASAPPLAVQGTIRALWAARELSPSQAIGLGYAFVGLGTSQDSLDEGQRAFAGGTRSEWRLR